VKVAQVPRTIQSEAHIYLFRGLNKECYMKTNIIIATAGGLTLLFFLFIPPNDILISILFGFSAIGVGSTIKFLILNILKIKTKQKKQSVTDEVD
jgi:hypothetical protein